MQLVSQEMRKLEIYTDKNFPKVVNYIELHIPQILQMIGKVYLKTTTP